MQHRSLQLAWPAKEGTITTRTNCVDTHFLESYPGIGNDLTKRGSKHEDAREIAPCGLSLATDT